MTVYVEPVSRDFWQLARDSSGYIDPLGPKDCMTHTASRQVHRALEGRIAGLPAVTGYNIRRHCLNPDGTVDTTAGVNHGQVQRAVLGLYGVHLTPYYGNSFDDLVDLVEATHGAGLSIWYEPVRDNAARRGSYTFYQNHEIFLNGVDRARSVFTGVVDPLADGRQAGLYHGPGEYSFALLKNAAGKLNVSSTGYRALGFGKAYFMVTPATGAPPSSSVGPQVVLSAPRPSERNTMIAQGGLSVTSSHIKRLAKGQPIFRYPAGPRVTAMSATGPVPYIGSAGSGWHAVKVVTKGPYADGVARPTILYVPAAAGPVERKA